ncbi:NmrA/HSCARG family protein [Catenuloplanes sp. NPDC051500]|uniref:NmrA/HSCARG family protein n=1 Tax=Catenuloplanes sp. NPDC051500 TaxID=3363959 RepID=UPI0037BBA7EA
MKISVVGATGLQGGAVVRALLTDGGFEVRAITRDPASTKARALAELGAEVVAADLGDEASLRAAFAGTDGAFLVTPYWEHMSPAADLAEMANMVSAAQAAGLRHVVWSTLEDTRAAIPETDRRIPVIDGYRVPHFDVKGGEGDALFAASGLPVTYLRLSFYWDNLLGAAGPVRGEDGRLALHLPIGDTPMAGITSDDIGRAVLDVFRRPAETIGATLGVATSTLTGAEIAEALSEAFGEQVGYQPLSHDAYRGLGFPGAVELGNMFQYYTEYPASYSGQREIMTGGPSLTEFLAKERAGRY